MSIPNLNLVPAYVAFLAIVLNIKVIIVGILSLNACVSLIMSPFWSTTCFLVFFHTSLSSSQPFFTNLSTDLFPTSNPLPDLESHILPISDLNQATLVDAPSDLSSAPSAEPEPAPVRRSTQQVMIEELQVLEKTHMWDYVDLPPGKKPIG